MTTTASTHTITDTVLLIMDGSVRAHSIARQILAAQKNLVVVGTHFHDLVPYLDATVRDNAMTVVADPAEPAQIDAVIERASESLGPVILVVDPGGLLVDVRAADRHAA